MNMLFRIRYLCIAIALKILKHVHEIIFSSVLYVLKSDFYLMIIKLTLFYGKCRSLRIIDRASCNLIRICLSGSWCSDGIRKLMRLYLKKVCIEDDLIPTVIHIIVLCRYVIDGNGTELSYRSEAAVNDSFCRYVISCILVVPSYENLP